MQKKAGKILHNFYFEFVNIWYTLYLSFKIAAWGFRIDERNFIALTSSDYQLSTMSNPLALEVL
jgi:hypothetical protein